MQALNAAVLAKVDGALQAAGDAMNAAGSDLQKAKADAQANLNKALADLEAAKGKVADSLKAFDDAKATVRRAVLSCRRTQCCCLFTLGSTGWHDVGHHCWRPS